MHLLAPKQAQKIAFGTMWVCAGIVVLPVVAIIAIMAYRGASSLSWKLLVGLPDGLLAPIVGTVVLIALTGLIAAPLGIAAAIYLSEYARRGALVRLIRLAIVNLAGVPSVVYGLFGLALFVIVMQFGRCLLSGACTLALLVLPLVISTSEEALRQVPRGLREGSLALGASHWQTVRRVVLPNALPGIITGLVLSISRAAGETAPILFTAAFYALTRPVPNSLLDPILVLPYKLFVEVTEVPDVPEETKWATALVLVALVVGLNLVAIAIRARLRAVRQW